MAHPKYQAWETSVNSNWLWVTADPGCGKSVLSRFLVDKFAASSVPAANPSATSLASAGQTIRNLTVCYFFFKDDSEESKSVTNAVSSLLHQLFAQKKDLLRHALPAHKTNGEKMKDLFDVLWEIFKTAVTDPDAGQIIVILDALDECAEFHRFQFISKIASLFPNSIDQGRRHLKLIATSRPHTSIGDQLWHDQVDIPSIHLMGEGEAEMDAIKIEIDLVIREKVRMFRELRQYRGIYDEVHETILERLLAVDNRTYLWVALVFPELEKCAGTSVNKLYNVIQNLPTTVDEAYHRILSRSTNKEHAKKLLNIVLAAVRPLMLDEMNIALAIEEDNQHLDDIDLEPAITFRTTVRELCGLFVSIRDDRIYLIHQTAKEFLVTEKKQDRVDALPTSDWKHSMNPLVSHYILALACVLYLRCVRSDDTSPKEGDGDQDLGKGAFVDSETDHFLRYAAVNWPYHYGKICQNQTILEKASYICHSPAHYSIWLPWYLGTPWGSSRCPKGITNLMISAFIGLPDILTNLLSQDGASVAARDYQGRTALIWALQTGMEITAGVLIEYMHTAGNYSDDLFASLQAASVFDRQCSISRLLDLGISPTELALDGWSAIRRIVWEGSEPIFQLMLPYAKNLSPDECHWLLRRASDGGKKGIISSLIKGGADINSRCRDGETILGRAVLNSDVSTIRLLLESGADPDMKTLDGWTECDRGSGETPLLQAINKHRLEVVSLLLDAGADVNLKNRNHTTALYAAVASDQDHVTNLLVARGAEVDARIGTGDTPARLALRKNNHSIVSVMQKHLDQSSEALILAEPVALRIKSHEAGLNTLTQQNILDIGRFKSPT